MMMMGTSERIYGNVARMHCPAPPLAADLASMRTEMLLVLRVLFSNTDLRARHRANVEAGKLKVSRMLR